MERRHIVNYRYCDASIYSVSNVARKVCMLRKYERISLSTHFDASCEFIKQPYLDSKYIDKIKYIIICSYLCVCTHIYLALSTKAQSIGKGRIPEIPFILHNFFFANIETVKANKIADFKDIYISIYISVEIPHNYKKYLWPILDFKILIIQFAGYTRWRRIR